MKTNVLMIVQNNSFPFDKRVYKEARTLNKAGHTVFVICPLTNYNNAKKEIIDGITVYRYKNSLSDGSIKGFLLEYLFALLTIYFLSIWLFISVGIKIVHAANPPDFFWPLSLIGRMFGVKFIYDQHDLAPEMFKLKFDNSLIYNFLKVNEKLTVRLSHGIICANGTFKKRLDLQVGINGQRNIILPNGPDRNFDVIRNEELVRKYHGKKIILYIGLMTVNDNIEIIIEAARRLVNDRHRKDCYFILLGDGDVRLEMELLSKKMGLGNNIEFTGIVEYSKVQEYLYISSIGIAPDQCNGLNEFLTHIKILEYMKAGKAFVSFDLEETKNISSGAGLFAQDIDDFVSKILYLVDNTELACQLGNIGKQIIQKNFIWEDSEKRLLDLYSSLT